MAHQGGIQAFMRAPLLRAWCMGSEVALGPLGQFSRRPKFSSSLFFGRQSIIAKAMSEIARSEPAAHTPAAHARMPRSLRIWRLDVTAVRFDLTQRSSAC